MADAVGGKEDGMTMKYRKAEYVCGINAMLFLSAGMLFNPGATWAAGTAGTKALPAHAGIVARQDFEANPALTPPEICGRSFWIMLDGGRLHFKSDTNPPPAPDKLTKFAVAAEPMVRDAALCYPRINLNSSTNPLVVDGARLLEWDNCDPQKPFILFVNRSNPQNYLDDFKTINRKAYQQWKEAHPNFLGFYAGNEIDAAYRTFFSGTSATQLVAQLQKAGASETAIARTLAIAGLAVKSKDDVLTGFRQWLFDGARRYLFDDPAKLVYLHSAWCIDHYPLEWGAGLVILETTSTGPYRHQHAMTSARGAARQYGKPWAWYMALCYNGYNEDGSGDNNAFPYFLMTNSAPVTSDPPGHVRGQTCGMSPSLLRRDFFLGYLSGASIVQPETYPYAFWKYKDNKYGDQYELSPHGKAMKEMYDFSRKYPDRGVSYAPVALLLPWNHAQACFGGSSWCFFPMTRADTMIDAFQFTILPHKNGELKKGQEGCLFNSEFGDIYDMLRPNPPSGPVPLKVLQNYPVAILLGEFNLDKPLAKQLMEYVKKGGTLVINTRQLNKQLPDEFIGARRTGEVCGTEGPVRTADGQSVTTLTEPYDYDRIELCGARPLWQDRQDGILASANDYGRGRVVLTTVDYMVPRKALNGQNAEWSAGQGEWHIGLEAVRDLPLIKLLMQQVVSEVLPLEVKGDIEYGLNKVSDGWWVYLINNKGVTKFTRTAEKLDPAAAANVTVNMRGLDAAQVQELRQGADIAWDKSKNSFSVNVGPGDIKVVKITVRGGK